MTDDPVRLLEAGGSELLCTLLSAAREERPENAALQRTLTAVGIGAALTTGAGAAAAAGAAPTAVASGALGGAALGTAKGVATSTLAIVVKWLSIGAVTGLLASTAAYEVGSALTPRPPPEAPSASASPVLLAPPSLPRVSTAVEDLPEIPRPPAVVSAPSAVAPAPVASQAGADSGLPLSAEVAALDDARQALSAGSAARVLDLLSDYETRFPGARMLPEALYLRLEAFTLKGDRSDAEAVARRILRIYPSSPHAARARAVLGLNQ